MSERRKFTDSFKLNDEVYIIRHAHGWEDGNVGGYISAISDYGCCVTSDDGCCYEILKPTDIRLEPFPKNKKRKK